MTTPKTKTSKHVLLSCYPPRRRSAIKQIEPSLTKQAFAEEVNINNIIQRFTKTGVIDHVNSAEPTYDFAPSHDYREALEILQNAEQKFAELPAEIRKKFSNNPAEFLAFAEDEDNLPKMAAMGLTSDSYTPASEISENAPTGKSEPPTTNDQLNASPTGTEQPEA